jgi:hypothetical protein
LAFDTVGPGGKKQRDLLRKEGFRHQGKEHRRCHRRTSFSYLMKAIGPLVMHFIFTQNVTPRTGAVNE